MKQICPILLFVLFAGAMPAQSLSPQIPDTLYYCGIKIVPDNEVKTLLAAKVNEIYASPLYFNKMVKLSQVYLPFVEEALRDMRVPQDLKYIPLLESGFKADALSTSQAVGFWQMKRETALECGLIVDEQVDERMHIFRSSLGGASYLAKSNQIFNNWLYAVIAYFAGPTGAIAFTEPAYYGAKLMYVNKTLHPYALKALAYKIAYEPALRMTETPDVSLVPFSTMSIIQVKRLAEFNNVPEAQLIEYNKWIVDTRHLPKEPNFTYYVPQPGMTGRRPGEDPTKQERQLPVRPVAEVVWSGDGNLDNLEKNPTQPAIPASNPPVITPSTPSTPSTQPTTPPLEDPVPDRSSVPRPPAPAPDVFVYPDARPASSLPMTAYADFDLVDDLHYGVYYIWFSGQKSIQEIALDFRILPEELLIWNQMEPGTVPPAGTLLYIQKPSKVFYHIVAPGEDLADISFIRGIPINKIRRNNFLRKDDYGIYEGQKLYLKQQKPKEERVIILNMPLRAVRSAGSDAPNHPPVLNPAPGGVPPQTPGSGSAPQQENSWTTYVVKPGDTLWNIAKAFNTQVEVIKKANNLPDNNIQPGQELKIFGRQP